jgi:hypothetical protein
VRITRGSEVIHLDGNRPTRAVEELHEVAATRTERREPVKLDYFRVADDPLGAVAKHCAVIRERS